MRIRQLANCLLSFLHGPPTSESMSSALPDCTRDSFSWSHAYELDVYLVELLSFYTPNQLQSRIRSIESQLERPAP